MRRRHGKKVKSSYREQNEETFIASTDEVQVAIRRNLTKVGIDWMKKKESYLPKRLPPEKVMVFASKIWQNQLARAHSSQ